MAKYHFRKNESGDWVITARVRRGKGQPTRIKQVIVKEETMADGVAELAEWVSVYRGLTKVDI